MQIQHNLTSTRQKNVSSSGTTEQFHFLWIFWRVGWGGGGRGRAARESTLPQYHSERQCCQLWTKLFGESDTKTRPQENVQPSQALA
jgi:hypothetical protein